MKTQIHRDNRIEMTEVEGTFVFTTENCSQRLLSYPRADEETANLYNTSSISNLSLSIIFWITMTCKIGQFSAAICSVSISNHRSWWGWWEANWSPCTLNSKFPNAQLKMRANMTFLGNTELNSSSIEELSWFADSMDKSSAVQRSLQNLLLPTNVQVKEANFSQHFKSTSRSHTYSLEERLFEREDINTWLNMKKYKDRICLTRNEVVLL